MTLEKTASLPPLDPAPVQVQITIHAQGNGYVAYVITNMGAFSLQLRLTPLDVKNLNTLLQEAIQQVASSFRHPDAYEKALGELAQTGNYAFRRIFDSLSQVKLQVLLRPGAALQIVSKDFFVPWDLLYDGPLDKEVNVSRYWGMKYTISRIIIQDLRDGAYVSPVIEAERPKVGFIRSEQLSFVETQEAPMLRTLHRDKRIQLTCLRDLSADQRARDLAMVGRFLRQKLHFLHFACHAYEEDPIEKSYLSVAKDFSVSIIDGVVNQYDLKHHPFVILNACLTSVINPLHTSSWAEKFWEWGARGVLATDFYVPDWFAASFSEALYRHLLAGKSIGQALLALRQEFWQQQRNPLALAYALYSSPSIKICSNP
jgi:hypothetical protein